MARAAHLSMSSPRPGETRRTANGPSDPGKGRGARSNKSGRYEDAIRVDVDDGWAAATEATISNTPSYVGDRFGAPVLDGGGVEAQNAAPPLKTEITIERPRKIITYNNSPDVGFDRSINPYRGCEHGCIYCFARPTHAYMGLSPGLDFETKLFAKPSAATLLAKELAHKKYIPRAVAMGTNTDPYQPIERKFQIMRGVLSTFARYNHPVTILTKAHLIIRDIDLLAPMAKKNLTRAMISITTQDKILARHMEPRASSPDRRFDAVRKLSDAGVSVGVMTAPMIPGLNDDEMEALLERARDAGASFVGYTIVRLPLEVSPLFREWLETYAPMRAGKIMRQIRDINGGKDYDPERSRSREIKSTYAKLIAQRFAMAVKRLGLATKCQPLDLTQFRIPQDASPQMRLFE